MLRPSRLVLVLILLAAFPVRADDHRAALLKDVTAIAAPGTPGRVLAFGPRAFSVVESGNGSVVAGGELGRGRLVLLCHGGYTGSHDVADTKAFLLNAADWASRNRPSGRRAGLIRAAGVTPLLDEAGFTTSELTGNWTTQLSKLDLVVCNGPNLNPKQVAALQRFVRNGGGIIAMQTPWGWQQITSQSLDENALNHLVAPAGLVWTGGYGSGSSGRFEVDATPRPLLNASVALDALQAHQSGEAAMTETERNQASSTLTSLAQYLPDDDRIIRPRLEKLRRQRADQLAPTKKKPLGSSQPLDRCLLALDILERRKLDADQVTPHPAAEAFPGVPPRNARRVKRSLSIDTSIPRWHSTGLYAVPGRTVRVSIPNVTQGLRVRIGAHKDKLWNKSRWDRAPEITRSWPLETSRTEVANAFGGPIYIEVPRNSPHGTVDIEIEAAVEAPWFQLGTTSNREWVRSIRDRPAPWAELASDSVILTVPSHQIRNLDDPEALMTFWERILDGAADLRGWDQDRSSPERYVTDMQISVGYMHSGYPLMTHLDAAERMVTLEKMQGAPWGLVHELGHNHQSGMWTFGGTVEVTCNLWSLYLAQVVCGVPWEQAHGSIGNREEKIRKYIAGGRDFNEWKRNPFLALQMYSQLVEAFGWEPYTQVFVEYDQLPKDQRPGTDAEKRDQWMIRMSRATGHDLGPFFEAWGVPVSQEARREIVDLPGWMPPDWPSQDAAGN